MSRHHRFDTIRARMTPARRAQNAVKTQALLADLGEDVQAPEPQRGEGPMGKVVELSEETYQQLADLAKQQQRTPAEMLRVCLATYEAALYERVHHQMVAEGLLEALPTRPLPPELEDFEPEAIPGRPLSEIIMEDRR
jgi:predicted transcriptional regulator